MDCAPAAVAKAAVAINIAAIFNFFMGSPSGKNPQPRCVGKTDAQDAYHFGRSNDCATGTIFVTLH
jgi:hypothetical protein